MASVQFTAEQRWRVGAPAMIRKSAGWTPAVVADIRTVDNADPDAVALQARLRYRNGDGQMRAKWISLQVDPAAMDESGPSHMLVDTLPMTDSTLPKADKDGEAWVAEVQNHLESGMAGPEHILQAAERLQSAGVRMSGARNTITGISSAIEAHKRERGHALTVPSGVVVPSRSMEVSARPRVVPNVPKSRVLVKQPSAGPREKRIMDIFDESCRKYPVDAAARPTPVAARRTPAAARRTPAAAQAPKPAGAVFDTHQLMAALADDPWARANPEVFMTSAAPAAAPSACACDGDSSSECDC